jgi:hypothetical protein
VYRWQDDVLERLERNGDNPEARQKIPIGSSVTGIEFIRSEEKSALLTLRISETFGHGPARRAELSAALGGDRR